MINETAKVVYQPTEQSVQEGKPFYDTFNSLQKSIEAINEKECIIENALQGLHLRLFDIYPECSPKAASVALPAGSVATIFSLVDTLEQTVNRVRTLVDSLNDKL